MSGAVIDHPTRTIAVRLSDQTVWWLHARADALEAELAAIKRAIRERVRPVSGG